VNTKDIMTLQKDYRKSFNWKFELAEVIYRREINPKTPHIRAMYRELDAIGYEWNGEFWVLKETIK